MTLYYYITYLQQVAHNNYKVYRDFLFKCKVHFYYFYDHPEISFVIIQIFNTDASYLAHAHDTA